MVIKPKLNRFSAKVVAYICIHICNIQGEQYLVFLGLYLRNQCHRGRSFSLVLRMVSVIHLNSC